MTQPLDLEAIKAKYAASTQGEWCVDDYVVNPGDSPGMWHVYEKWADDGPLMSGTFNAEANARSIAALHNSFPQMCQELERLTAQLPEGMKHCTIQFKECEKGHGRLIATNWIDHGCPHCERERVRELEGFNNILELRVAAIQEAEMKRFVKSEAASSTTQR